MSLQQFLKHTGLKREKKVIAPPPDVKAEENSETIAGWSSYRIHSETPTIAGRNRTFFQYGLLSPVSAYLEKCGISCFHVFDPGDTQRKIHFRNNGEKLVRIEWGGQVRLLEPKEVVIFSLPDGLSETLPRIDVLNGGV